MLSKAQSGIHAAPSQDSDILFCKGAFSKLIPELQRALFQKGYRKPTPIQEQSIPPLLDGRDMLGSAHTGTGKTAAFVLPILQRLTLQKKTHLKGKPRVLIIAPTRELAAQIGDSISLYGRHLHISRTVIFGGIKQHSQVESLSSGKHIVIATPGRLLDLLHQNHISLDAIETFVLDEADRMLDMGFLPDIRRIIDKLPLQRQTIFFSATLSPDVMQLARLLVKNPVEIAITPDVPAVEEIRQALYYVDKTDKPRLLIDMLADEHMTKVLVFTKMKHVADRIAKKLNDSGITSGVIHSDKAQNARIRSLDNFKSERVRVLVATDIAARGIDVDKISHVINYDLPNEPQTYVHRIGRTARAGTTGNAISMCSAEERESLHKIESFTRKTIPVVTDHKYHSDKARQATGAAARPAQKKQSDSLLAARSRARLTSTISYSDRSGIPPGRNSREKKPGHGK